MKKIIALILTLICLFAFAGCNGKKDSSKLKIGVIQYMSHPSLDNCYNGIKQALKESGLDYTIDYQTGSSTAADSDCSNFAKNMVSDNCDIIIAIATPAAKAAFTATADTEIPVIFCAVSDPVSAGLVKSLKTPGDLCTGTSDVLDLSAQLDLIKSMQPEVKKIGVLYTSSEENSITNLKNFKKVCEKNGIELVSSAVQGASDIPTAADNLASKVDCINNFTDNNVVNNLSVLLSAADKYGIPVYGSEEEQVKNGCLASVSIDYVSLGKTTGNMAVDVLGGADITKMAVKSITDATPIVNKKVLSSLGITMPQKYTNVNLVGE